MIWCGTKPEKETQEKIKKIIESLKDIYSDFYITKNNIRLNMKENIDVLLDCLSKGDIIHFSEDEGIAFYYGFSDKSSRVYLKLLIKDSNKIKDLLDFSFFDCDIYVKIKKNNPLRKLLYKYGFNNISGRGSEILLIRKKG